MRGHPRRGAALLTVLVFAAFLSLLAGAATRTALSGVRAARAFADAARADALGRGAAEALAYRLATGDAAARRGGAVALRFPGADVTIDYLSESARVDANLAPLALIAPLLTAAGAEPAEAEAVSARVARFRAEASARATAAAADDAPRPAPGGLAALRAAVDALGPAHERKPAPGPAAIRDPAEVAGAWGLSDALARRLLPELTVSGGAATVDPVLADRTVVLALLGDDARVDDYLARRSAGFVNKASAVALLPVPARDLVSFEDSPAVRALVRVRVADRMQRRYEVILAPPQRGPAPGVAGGAAPASGQVPVVVSWRRLP